MLQEHAYHDGMGEKNGDRPSRLALQETHEDEEEKMFRQYLDWAMKYTSPSCSEDEKRKILHQAGERMDFMLLGATSGATLFDDPTRTVEEKINLLTLLDDTKLEMWKRENPINRESWDIFMHHFVEHPGSALLSYKALAIYGHGHDFSLEQVPLDHAKAALLDVGRYLIAHPAMTGAYYIDSIIHNGKRYWNGFPELLAEVGEEQIWNNLTDEQVRTLWAELVEDGGDDEIREVLATEHLRARYSDARDRLGTAVPKEMIVTDISADAIGIFDTVGRLQSVSSRQDANLHPLAGERLFASSPQMPEAERKHKEQAVRDVSSAMDLRAREFIEEDFSVHLSELTLREQVWFVSTLRVMSPKDQRRAEKFGKSYGVDGIRAFLSAEFGDEFREYVLMIGEKLPKKDAQAVFEAFAKIAEFAQTSAAELLAEFFVEGKGQPVDAAKIEMELLKRAKNVIEDFAKEAMTAKATGKKPDSAALLKKLERADADTVLFTSIFKAAYKGKRGVDFEKIRGLEFSERAPATFTDVEREEALKIFDANWVDQDQVAAEGFRHTLEQKMDVSNDDTHFYVLKKDGRMMAFIRFDRRDDLESGAYYGGSFNVAEEFRGSAIGEAMMLKTIDEEAVHHVLYAHVVPDALVGTNYVEDERHMITGVDRLRSADGKETSLLRIRRDDRLRPAFRSTREDATHEALLHGLDGVMVRMYNLKKEKKTMLDDLARLPERGEVATRYWADAEDPMIRYIAFESMPASEEERLAA